MSSVKAATLTPAAAVPDEAYRRMRLDLPPYARPPCDCPFPEAKLLMMLGYRGALGRTNWLRHVEQVHGRTLRRVARAGIVEAFISGRPFALRNVDCRYFRCGGSLSSACRKHENRKVAVHQRKAYNKREIGEFKSCRQPSDLEVFWLLLRYGTP